MVPEGSDKVLIFFDIPHVEEILKKLSCPFFIDRFLKSEFRLSLSNIAHLLIVFVPCEVVTNFMSLVAAIQKLTVRFFGLLVGRAMMLKF